MAMMMPPDVSCAADIEQGTAQLTMGVGAMLPAGTGEAEMKA
eukprot:COSAG02_NODE_21321_length_793_cov_1.240634_1_plen_41_part_01